MKRIRANAICNFQRKIFHWWATHRRDLPWRDTSDPYHILVSEVMLQQTQVRRVLPKYAEFIEAFPDVYALAQATPAKVLRVWKGMGYNRRALYLKKTAEIIIKNYHGEFPKSESELVKLPGLGKYTARAIMVFAYRMDIAMVDTNIRQIITHFFFNGLPQKEKDIQAIADVLVPRGQSWEWHQALMDYGASKKWPTKNKKKVVPFKGSNRFYRGKIVDLLRKGSINEKDMIVKMRSVVDSLLRDGLAIRSKGKLMLPR